MPPENLQRLYNRNLSSNTICFWQVMGSRINRLPRIWKLGSSLFPVNRPYCRGKFKSANSMDGASADHGAVFNVPARRGRPCQIGAFERRQRLIEAAECEFLESGYGAAATNNIARRAGMSKKTLYRLFDSK